MYFKIFLKNMRIDKRFSLKNCLKRSKSIKKNINSKNNIGKITILDDIMDNSSSLLGFDELFDEDYDEIINKK